MKKLFLVITLLFAIVMLFSQQTYAASGIQLEGITVYDSSNNLITNIYWEYPTATSNYVTFAAEDYEVMWSDISYIHFDKDTNGPKNPRFTKLIVGNSLLNYEINIEYITDSAIYIDRYDLYGTDPLTTFEFEYEMLGQVITNSVVLPVDSQLMLIDNEYGSVDYRSGYEKAYEDLYNSRYNSGYDVGYDDGYTAGVVSQLDEIDQAYHVGYVSGETSGYSDGYTDAESYYYHNGFGLDDNTSASFIAGFAAAEYQPDAERAILTAAASILGLGGSWLIYLNNNFSLFGITLFIVIGVIIAVSAILWLLKR